MRRCFYILALLPLFCTSCYVARIVTVSPDAVGVNTYSTTVTVPKTQAVSTTTHVYAADDDISLYLDLQAVGAAFAQASTVQEFEKLLNNSSYMLSNLDLNRDGYVDYLRVLETVNGYAHVFLIQAVLGDNVYQDVATLVAEVSNLHVPTVQIIGSPYIYGPSYIVEPVYVATPLIFAHLLRAAYHPWHSPWYWNHFPSWYRHPAPIFLDHYHAYVRTYMSNHHYCHRVEYGRPCHYPEYSRVSRSWQRNDYGYAHPEESFTHRTADIPLRTAQRAGGSEINARDIRESYEASTINRGNSTARSATSGVSRSADAGSATGRAAATSATSRGTVTTSSPARTGTTSQPRSSSIGSAGTSGMTSAVTRSPSTTSQPSGQTTVRSRVTSSGSSSTRISSTSPSGSTTTTRRSSTPSSSVSGSSSSYSRSSSSTAGSPSRSASSSSGSTAGRSTGSGTGRSASGSVTRR